MSQALPFLPGYNVEVKSKNNFHKSHLFDVQNGVRVDTMKATDLIDARSFPVNSESQLSFTTAPNDFANSVDAKYRTSNSVLDNSSSLPAWVAYDRKVLRFYCYFKEAVFSSPKENYRLRKCVMYYYLEDDSVHIAEPKIENSGIPQGVFVKRHRIPKTDNVFVNLNDLKIGNALNIYGRSFYLYECDNFTRSFFAETGQGLAPNQPLPSDPFTRKNTVEVGTHKKLMHPMKEFMEASLGKQMGVDIRSTQKFLKNDGQVLRFYCVWHDEKMLGESRPYVVHYFLADDTVEVMEVKQANSGRDPFPALLKRSKLPRQYAQTAPDLTNIGNTQLETVQYYTERDIKIGDYVNVYGRQLLVCGCDIFTKQFYINNYDMKESDFPAISNEDEVVPPPRMAPPEHNGFGTEEDSLGSFLYLTPKVPKIDFKKQMENDGLNLRFLAKLIDPSAEDKDRSFIITYFMNNDTISIFEKFERNSGFIGGKFLERARIKNPKDGEFYTQRDLVIGGQIQLNSFGFSIVDADDFTKKFMERNPEHFSRNGYAEEGYPAEANANPSVAF